MINQEQPFRIEHDLLGVREVSTNATTGTFNRWHTQTTADDRIVLPLTGSGFRGSPRV